MRLLNNDRPDWLDIWWMSLMEMSVLLLAMCSIYVVFFLWMC